MATSMEIRVSFASAISTCKGDIHVLQAIFIDVPGMEVDKKSILEQAFRDVLHKRIISLQSKNTECLTDLVLLASSAANLGISFYTVPFILLSDIFDCLILDVCENMFIFVESHVSTWVSAEFYSSGKILLLRMCNDLLRRLSAPQNTVFCGRIQLFLAQLFPLSEKSALNLMSHFNLENVTAFTNEEELLSSKDDSTPKGKCEAMDVDSEEVTVPIDFNLYQKLWSIQDYFRQPTQCYLAEQWKTLTANMEEILKAFKSYKLEEEVRSSSRKIKIKPASVGVADANEYNELHYFSKFLTSEKLMSLQLRDSHFRRHILIQCLILFQYLSSSVKFKGPSHVLTDTQATWIKNATDKVYALIKETPPNGEEFAAYVRQVLVREDSWIVWKNGGCPSYEKRPLELELYPEKMHLGDGCDSNKIDIGNTELSRLWNLCPDNLKACEQMSRVFIPDKVKFLEEPIEQTDPDAKIEVEYKMVNNPNFTWQALRLLSSTSPHYFQNTTASIKPIPDYLEHVIVQEGKDMQQQRMQAAAIATSNGMASWITPTCTQIFSMYILYTLGICCQTWGFNNEVPILSKNVCVLLGSILACSRFSSLPKLYILVLSCEGSKK